MQCCIRHNLLWFCRQVNPYKLHRLDEAPETEVATSKSELLDMFRSMYTVRSCQLVQTLHAQCTSHNKEMFTQNCLPAER
jgi:hypothetical protein